MMEDQERYSVDIAKALKQSGQQIPEPVQAMVDSFLEKVKAGKEKASTSGFGGKGLERLDKERDAARNRERRTYKTGDEGEEEEEKDEKKNEQAEEQFNKVISSVQSASTPLPGVPKGIDLDGKITVHKREVDPNAPNNPLDKVGSAVTDIHARLSRAGVMRSGVPIDNRGPDAGAFHATLEINDFPRKFPIYNHLRSQFANTYFALQKKLDGRLRIAQMWPRFSRLRAHLLPPRVASTQPVKSPVPERTPSFTFWSKVKPSCL